MPTVISDKPIILMLCNIHDGLIVYEMLVVTLSHFVCMVVCGAILAAANCFLFPFANTLFRKVV